MSIRLNKALRELNIGLQTAVEFLEKKPNLGEEMADVLWVLLCLANQTGVNLTEELQRSFAKKTSRDKDRHKNNPKLTDNQQSNKA